MVQLCPPPRFDDGCGLGTPPTPWFLDSPLLQEFQNGVVRDSRNITGENLNKFTLMQDGIAFLRSPTIYKTVVLQT